MGRRKTTATSQQKVRVSRRGLPSPDSVVDVITKVAPSGRRFRILKTTEMDAYDKPSTPRPERKRGPK
jgi:hypothetical protein